MILAISGKLRTGKNSVADHLIAQYHFKQGSFADKLKQICIELFGLTHEECYGEKTPRSRDVLQRVGVAMREIDPDVWCKYLLKNIKEGDDAVISDVRFPNEAEMVKKYGGIIIRVNRNTGEQFGSSHISETALDDYEKFDYVIDNNETLESLYEKIDFIMKDVLLHGN